MFQRIVPALILLLLESCSEIPSGPNVLVLPGSGKDLQQFQSDEAGCRQIAHNQIVSMQKKPDSNETAQRLYDMSFIQCMYEKGHRVPLSGNILYREVQEEAEETPIPDEIIDDQDRSLQNGL